MKIAFPYPGGKSKILDDLFPYFPEEGGTYIEPFAGRGNVFFEWKKVSLYQNYIINDIQQGPFFEALRDTDLDLLPPESEVNEFTFDNWHNRFMAGDPIAMIIEPKITFRGKGYSSGYQTGRYNRKRYMQMCAAAQQQLQGVKIYCRDYVNLEWEAFNEDDFVYLDPPYYETSGVGLRQIDHQHLLNLLKDAKFKWALSGYYSDLYVRNLGEPILQLERNIEMTDDRGATAIECLWTGNY